MTIEPVEENLRLLRKNVELHELDNVVIIGRARSRERRMAKLVKSKLSGELISSKPSAKPEFPVSEVEVEVTTIDEVYRDFGLFKIDFLKIDVKEGRAGSLERAEESLKGTMEFTMRVRDKE